MLERALRIVARHRLYPERFLERVASATLTVLSDGHLQLVIWMADGTRFVELVPPEALAA